MKTILKLALAGLMALASVVPALAQDSLKADIPFAFNVGSKAMPAGEYEVQPGLSKSVVLRNVTTHDNAIALFMTASPGESSGRASILFHQYGDSYFLEKVSTPDSQKFIGMSKLEKQTAARARESAQNAARSNNVRVEALAK